MKLTDKDKAMLRSLGYEDRDFPQIEEAARETRYDLDGKQISQSNVVKLLGRENILSGLSRSAFHWTAVQTTDDGREVGFDSSAMFRRW